MLGEKRESQINDLLHQKDPRGLVQRDVVHLEKVFKQRPIQPNMTQNEIMFQAGQQSVIDYIQNKVVA